MSKILDNESKNVASFVSGIRQQFLKSSLIIIRLLLIIFLLVSAFPWLYEIKSRIGIDIFPGIHTGSVVEEYTHGIVKCEWLYPYSCEQRQVSSNNLSKG